MATATEIDIGSLIQRREGVNGGRPCLAGTGVSVEQVAVLFNQGRTARDIVADYPQLDLCRVHAGITYYLANKAEVDADLAEEAAAYAKGLAAQLTAAH